MKNSLFQVVKRHRVKRCLFSLFCLSGALLPPVSAFGYTILHDDYGEQVGYERTGLTNESLTVAIRYLDWNETATDNSLVRFDLENGYCPELMLGPGNIVLGRCEPSKTNNLATALSLSHEGGLLFAQQDMSALTLSAADGKAICKFSCGWSGKEIGSIKIGDIFTLVDITIFDSCLTSSEMKTYASGIQYGKDREWSNFIVCTKFNGHSTRDVTTFSLSLSDTNGISKCDIPTRASVSITSFGVPSASATKTRFIPDYMVLSQDGVASTGACTVITSGATLALAVNYQIERDMVWANFNEPSVLFNTSRAISISFLDKDRSPTSCTIACLVFEEESPNASLKIGDKEMPFVKVLGDVFQGNVVSALDPARRWFKLDGVTVTRSYVDTWLPNADWTTVSGRREICDALAAPRAAGAHSNGYSLLDSWALGLNPTNASSVVRLNLKQDTSSTFKLGFENVKTNREAFVRQSYAIKHAATLEGLESAEYSETGSEMTVPLDDIESVQFYRGKISFDPL